MKDPLVTVIVTTRNSASTLGRCLQSVQDQSYKNLELIVVDNHSQDKTREIARTYTSRVLNDGTERSAQRNRGAGVACGKYLFFLDSDMILSTDVIKECVQLLHNDKVKGIYVPEIIMGTGYWPQVRNFERSFYTMTVIDAVRCMSKQTFIDLEGFDENLFAGEDWNLDLRLRQIGMTACIDAPLYHDESRFSLSNYFRKKSYYSSSLDVYREKWLGNQDVNKQFNPIYRYILVFIEKDKWKKLIRHPHLALGMFFLRCIVGLSYLLSYEKNTHHRISRSHRI